MLRGRSDDEPLAGAGDSIASGIVMLGAFNAQLDSRLAALDLTLHMRQTLDDQRIKLAAMEIPRESSPATQEKIRQSIGGPLTQLFYLAEPIAD